LASIDFSQRNKDLEDEKFAKISDGIPLYSTIRAFGGGFCCYDCELQQLSEGKVSEFK
jgi:hypothetical protein